MEGRGSKVPKEHLSETLRNSIIPKFFDLSNSECHFGGTVQLGEYKVTKEYLSKTFRNSIILKGSKRLFFHKGWDFIMFDL